MKITKFGHSCVLVKTQDRVGLFDPGGYSDRKLIDTIEHVDRIIYTHEHSDHFDIEILKSLVDKFPGAMVICNKQIGDKIADAGVSVIVRAESNCTRKFDSPHEQLPFPGVVAPTQNGYHFKDLFTHPGDSQSFSETKKVLAMPFIGPWGKTGDSVDKVLELRPAYVLPIHDWHYSPEANQWLKEKLEPVLKGNNIILLPYENGIELDIN